MNESSGGKDSFHDSVQKFSDVIANVIVIQV